MKHNRPTKRRSERPKGRVMSKAYVAAVAVAVACVIGCDQHTGRNSVAKPIQWRDDCLLSSSEVPFARAIDLKSHRCLREHPWKIYRRNDQVTVATTTLLGLTPYSNLPLPIPRLVLRCRKSTVDAAIDWDRFIGREDVAVTYRIDKSPPVVATWSISTSSTAAIVPEGQVRQFVDSLRSKNVLIAQVTTDQGAKVDGTFILTDANRAIDAVLAACNSDRPPKGRSDEDRVFNSSRKTARLIGKVSKIGPHSAQLARVLDVGALIATRQIRQAVDRDGRGRRRPSAADRSAHPLDRGVPGLLGLPRSTIRHRSLNHPH